MYLNSLLLIFAVSSQFSLLGKEQTNWPAPGVDGQRSSLVASIDPRGLVGYAMEMVEGLSPAGSRSPTPPRMQFFLSLVL